MTIDYERQFQSSQSHEMMLDHDLRFIDVSAGFCSNVGLPRERLVGQYVFDVFPAEGEPRETIETAFRTSLAGEPTTIERFLYDIPDYEGSPGAMKRVWWSVVHTPIFDEAGKVSHIAQLGRNVSAEVLLDELNDTILREMQHRIGNVFALIGSIARQTIRHSDSLDQFADNFEERLHALSSANSLLTDGHWDEVHLLDLLERVLAPYFDNGAVDIALDTKAVVLSVTHAQPFSMALHELTTNAAKYGALAGSGGSLTVSWKPVGRKGLTFEWTESGIDASGPPNRSGFGTLILTKILPTQLGGEAQRTFEDGVMRYRLDIPDA